MTIRMIAASAVVALSAISAEAATFSLDYTLPTPGGDVLAPSSTTGDVRLNFVGNDLTAPAPNSRSPWDATAFLNDPEAKYHSVSANSSLTYDFGSSRSQFSLMWGSPDSYNTLAFYLDDALVYSLTGTDVDNPPAPGMGFVNVLVSGLAFNSVVFTSGSTDAFEFANVSAVPLPAAAWMLISALAGLGYLGRRRAAAAA